MFRLHDAQKTQHIVTQTDSMLDVAEALLKETDAISPTTKRELLADLQAYRKAHPTVAWKHTGRLSRLGLPSSVVTPLRHLRKTIASAVTDLTRAAK
jgi:hypothetical protein